MYQLPLQTMPKDWVQEMFVSTMRASMSTCGVAVVEGVDEANEAVLLGGDLLDDHGVGARSLCDVAPVGQEPLDDGLHLPGLGVGEALREGDGLLGVQLLVLAALLLGELPGDLGGRGHPDDVVLVDVVQVVVLQDDVHGLVPRDVFQVHGDLALDRGWTTMFILEMSWKILQDVLDVRVLEAEARWARRCTLPRSPEMVFSLKESGTPPGHEGLALGRVRGACPAPRRGPRSP